jgi:hypothetical protein
LGDRLSRARLVDLSDQGGHEKAAQANPLAKIPMSPTN